MHYLPRQARDEHRENSKKVPFSCSGGSGTSSGAAGSSGSYGTFEAANAFDASSGAAAAGRLSRVIEQLRRPIEWICHHTIPHEPEPGEETTRWLGCEKRHCLRHLYIKPIILPRQARDKHRENSKKGAVFRTVRRAQPVSLRCENRSRFSSIFRDLNER